MYPASLHKGSNFSLSNTTYILQAEQAECLGAYPERITVPSPESLASYSCAWPIPQFSIEQLHCLCRLKVATGDLPELLISKLVDDEIGYPIG